MRTQKPKVNITTFLNCFNLSIDIKNEKNKEFITHSEEIVET